MEVNETRGAVERTGTESNRRDWKTRDDMSLKGKKENIRESIMGPQGAGPCARVNKISYRESRPNRWTKLINHGTLRVTCDP